MEVKTLDKKIFIAFLVYSIVSLFVAATSFWLFRQLESNRAISQHVNLLFNKTMHLIKQGQDFRIYDATDEEFYRSGHSPHLVQYSRLLKEVYALEDTLKHLRKIEAFHISNQIDTLNTLVHDYTDTFSLLISKIRRLGFRNYGLEGQMRKYIHELESHPDVDKVKLLTIRRHEKDFMAWQDMRFARDTEAAVEELRLSISRNQKHDEATRKHLQDQLEKYLATFKEIEQVEQEIGYRSHEGLNAQLGEKAQKIDELVSRIDDITIAEENHLSDGIQVILLVTITVAVLLSIFMAMIFKLVMKI